ncbi:hypothetical protein [Sphingomonas psychrotolerans]|uniref:C-type lysozyme inhibitor domain-containing protein n=1 Tax=Sphingomonas psychrotolerans TaxID=1327635 RepID=A0A2K8MDJ5_9SPHN|nr:hypothetical protein [Sphingomonas psychrotolerans]ATY31933.1 hypothetical protein CVN68_08080 [Sphingomonas psychrotolerans]
MKNPPLIAAAVVALLSLAACENKPEEVTSTAPDPMASQLANAAPVELPPAIAETVTLRCGDNSLVYLDFFQGNKQVQLKTDKAGPATMLKAPEAGQPFEAAGGYKLTGTPKNVSVTLPGKPAKTCHA